MSKTNHLTSHHGESRAHRADKMCSIMEIEGCSANSKMRFKTFLKHFTNRKRRMFLKNPYNWDKI